MGRFGLQGFRPVGLHRLPVVCCPFRAYLVRVSVGASLGWATVAQGVAPLQALPLACGPSPFQGLLGMTHSELHRGCALAGSTACLWSVALSGLAWCGHLSGLRLIGCSHYTGVLPCRAPPPTCNLTPFQGYTTCLRSVAPTGFTRRSFKCRSNPNGNAHHQRGDTLGLLLLGVLQSLNRQ